jgi:hypothetical protein
MRDVRPEGLPRSCPECPAPGLRLVVLTRFCEFCKTEHRQWGCPQCRARWWPPLE